MKILNLPETATLIITEKQTIIFDFFFCFNNLKRKEKSTAH